MLLRRSGFSGASKVSVSRNLQLLEHKPKGIRPTASPNSVCEIVRHKNNHETTCFIKYKGDTVSPICTPITIDSGACDAVAPPQAFMNTELKTNNKEQGKVYGTCGGELVRNIGCKSVGFVTSTGETNTNTKSKLET